MIPLNLKINKGAMQKILKKSKRPDAEKGYKE
jgi:hypothetical protein